MGSIISRSALASQGHFEMESRLLSVETTLIRSSWTFTRQVPRYFGKSTGVELATEPSLIARIRSAARTSASAKALSLRGMLGNSETGKVEKRILFRPAVSVPRS